MGQSYTFKCYKCAYYKESSGKLDCGFLAVVEPYICNDCHELTDVLVGEHGEKFPIQTLTKEKLKEFYNCGECKSKNIAIWDTRKKPCPKCGSRMKKDPKTILLWD